MAQTRLSTRELGDGQTDTADIKDLAVTDAKVATANKDGAAATPSMRTLGSGPFQAAAGNDPRLSDPRTPTAHMHGNITSGGLVGVTASLPLITGPGGLVQTGAWGSTSGTFAQGNDARFSDARAPLAHTHDWANIISGKPVTIAGYGITDFNSLGDVRWAPKVSPVFTGIPVVPTAAPGTNTGQVASTAFVKAAISSNPRLKDIIVATAGQAVFYSGVPYAVGSMDVYFNGAKLAPSEYTATNTTSITISAAAIGSVIELNYGATSVNSVSVMDNSLAMAIAMLFN